MLVAQKKARAANNNTQIANVLLTKLLNFIRAPIFPSPSKR